MQRERVVVFEGLDERDIPVREPVPPLALMPIFEPLGERRGEWERVAAQVAVEYVGPARRAA